MKKNIAFDIVRGQSQLFLLFGQFDGEAAALVIVSIED